MNRTKVSAIILVLAMGMALSALAKNRDDVRSAHQQNRIQDRARWQPENRAKQQRQQATQRREREVIHRWDREHSRHSMYVRQGATRQNSYVNHHYEPRGFPYRANQQGMKRP